MLRTFTSLALLAIAAIAEETQDVDSTNTDQSLVDQATEAFEETLDDGSVGQTAAEVQCQLRADTYGAAFTLLDLEKDTAYSSAVTGVTGDTLLFNYCTYGGDIPDEDSYAYLESATGADFSVADDAIALLNAFEAMRNDDMEIIGCQFTQSSDTECTAADEAAGTEAVNWSMFTQVTCDETITGAGNARVDSVSVDGCVYTVKLTHDSGCYSGVDTYGAVQWLAENEGGIGIMYLVVGPLLALFGAAWFPYVVASLVAIFTIGLICSLSLAAGWMATGLGTGIVLAVAIIVGVIVGILVRRNVWIMVGLLGLIGGFFSGALIFALIAGMTGSGAVWVYWVVSVLAAVAGCVAACYLGKTVVIGSTALVGSYLFMRAWTLFFPGHYPSEAQLMEDPASIEYDAVFWVFIAIFIASFIGSTVFQCKKDDTNEELDDYYKAD